MMKSSREFMEAIAAMDYAAMFPWERFWYNRARRKRGLPPMR